jgi:hypothetical protein
MHWKATQDLVEERERYLGLAFLCDHHVSIMRQRVDMVLPVTGGSVTVKEPFRGIPSLSQSSLDS